MQDFNFVQIDNDKKIQILLHALSERYNAIHKIRERVQGVCLWALGLFSTVGGWLVQSKVSLLCEQRLLFSTIILVVVLSIRCLYLKDLERGFKNQQRIQAKLENVLKLCEDGVYSSDPLYPSEWQNAGQKKGRGNFFLHNYLLLYIGAGILLLSIWLK